jgi:hypothetical protein
VRFFSNSYAYSRANARAGHWASSLLIACIVAAVALRVRPIDPANPLALILPVLLIVVVIASWLQMRSHSRSLCELCMSSIPLNPSASAARYRRRLAVVHLGSRRPLVGGYLVVLIGSIYLPGTVGVWIWGTVQLSMIYLLVSTKSHRLLQPWCPQCRGDGGGGKHDANAPDPIPQGSHRS